jgi:hypothetical protein
MKSDGNANAQRTALFANGILYVDDQENYFRGLSVSFVMWMRVNPSNRIQIILFFIFQQNQSCRQIFHSQKNQ